MTMTPQLATGMTVACLVLMAACTPSRYRVGDEQKMLADSQAAVIEAEQAYRKAVLEHGQSSNEAIKAKTAIDQARNKLAADQQRVRDASAIGRQQEQINAAPPPNPIPAPPPS